MKYWLLPTNKTHTSLPRSCHLTTSVGHGPLTTLGVKTSHHRIATSHRGIYRENRGQLRPDRTSDNFGVIATVGQDPLTTSPSPTPLTNSRG